MKPEDKKLWKKVKICVKCGAEYGSNFKKDTICPMCLYEMQHRGKIHRGRNNK